MEPLPPDGADQNPTPGAPGLIPRRTQSSTSHTSMLLTRVPMAFWHHLLCFITWLKLEGLFYDG
nr:hypothetical protein Itr_chr10CG11740 [Ipomoea trifida]